MATDTREAQARELETIGINLAIRVISVSMTAMKQTDVAQQQTVLRIAKHLQDAANELRDAAKLIREMR